MSLDVKRGPSANKPINGKKAAAVAAEDIQASHKMDGVSQSRPPDIRQKLDSKKTAKVKGRDPLDTCTLGECLDRSVMN